MKKSVLASLAVAALMVSCSGGKSWKIDGTVSNAPDGTKLAVERLSDAGWVTIDSIPLKSDGSFSYTAEDMPLHDIYRVSLGGKTVDFPIDSLDCVTLTADAATFDTDYKLSGTPLAECMMDVNTMINTALRDNGVDYVLTDSVFRRDLGKALVADTTGIVAYYVINRRIGGRPLFSDANAFDLRIIGAVANRFNLLRPKDPRTAMLAAIYGNGRRNASQGSMIEANVAGYIDISLPDERGNTRTLADVVDDAKTTALNFTAYLGNDVSPLMNAELNRLRDAYPGLEIYQVSIDDNEAEWAKVARNLPWTTVWAGNSKGVAVLGNYNLLEAPLPATFIINNKGELVERVSPEDLANDEKALEKAVQRHF